jgi:hypothetical protein
MRLFGVLLVILLAGCAHADPCPPGSLRVYHPSFSQEQFARDHRECFTQHINQHFGEEMTELPPLCNSWAYERCLQARGYRLERAPAK